MPMNFAALFRAFDAAVALRDATRRFKGDPPPPAEAGLTTTSGAGSALVGQIETRLTNVVVAALKEAFDRDTHASSSSAPSWRSSDVVPRRRCGSNCAGRRPTASSRVFA